MQNIFLGQQKQAPFQQVALTAQYSEFQAEFCELGHNLKGWLCSCFTSLTDINTSSGVTWFAEPNSSSGPHCDRLQVSAQLGRQNSSNNHAGMTTVERANFGRDSVMCRVLSLDSRCPDPYFTKKCSRPQDRLPQTLGLGSSFCSGGLPASSRYLSCTPLRKWRNT